MKSAPPIAAIVLASLLPACGAGDRGPRPSIVLVSIDSLRADHVGCYGYPKPTTPTIDAVAAAGVRFADAVSTTSWTLPAHASMFTGMYDSAHGLVTNGLALSESLTTLAEVLRDDGYATAGFFGGPYLHPVYGLAQGFQTYESCMMDALSNATGDGIRKESQGAFQAAHRDVTSPRTLEKVAAWCKSSDEKPFFAFVHLWDVHYDYIPPRQYVEMFDPDYRGHLNADDYFINQEVRPGMDPRDLEHVLALYDGEIRFTDDHLAKILDQLAQRAGGADNLLVVVVADHGDEFFEHGGKGHQRTLYEEVLHVPMVFRWPGHLPAGRVVEEQVRLIDLMPTLVAAASAPAPKNMQGRNLLPLLAQPGPLPTEPALSELHVPPYDLRGLRTEGFKLISRDRGKAFEAYDLLRDPAETQNLSEADPRFPQAKDRMHQLVETAAELRERLKADPKLAAPDPAIEKMLKELGYAGK